MVPPSDTPLRKARALAEGRHLCFLDRALEQAGSGRWPMVLSDPLAVYHSKDGRGTLRWRDRLEPADGDPFRIVQELLDGNPERIAAGYWSYDLRYQVERLPRRAVDDLELPDCWVGLYERPANGSSTNEPVLVDTAPQSVSCEPPFVVRTSRVEYEACVRRVLEYIAAGDCYQVNLSHRLEAPAPGAAWALYERLRRASPAPYAAYLDCGDHQVLSSSPELFLRIKDGEVETHPIKGTRPRGSTPDEDRALAEELLHSAKDRAELLMIVDLERNDLGRVCEYGSVQVPRSSGDWARLESYSNVHHLVSTVRGRLRPDVGPLACLRACFPGGSITGAPKIRAMEIIEELEPVRRGVYTGAIGWVDGRGCAEWNIAIRTMVVKDGRVYFHVGGGIVADSDPSAEYDETLAKARGMLAALGG